VLSALHLARFVLQLALGTEPVSPTQIVENGQGVSFRIAPWEALASSPGLWTFSARRTPEEHQKNKGDLS
jgi:hypothetical protein